MPALAWPPALLPTVEPNQGTLVTNRALAAEEIAEQLLWPWTLMRFISKKAQDLIAVSKQKGIT